MSKIAEFISTPGVSDVFHENKEHRFGLYETKGRRESMEDAAYACWYTPETFKNLAPQDIGHRLWTSYHLLNQKISKECGTTASTTVYDGRGNLITATLGDSLAFVAVYNKTGKIAGVIRLNQLEHHPDLERERIKAAGGTVDKEKRLAGEWGSLAVSRSLGDASFPGICADASIDIITLSEIYYKLEIAPEDVSQVQIITTCDGFAEKYSSSKAAQETWLFSCLADLNANDYLNSEEQIAWRLGNKALASGSGDNLSIIVQTLVHGKPCMHGVYDGHGGVDAAIYAAQNIGGIFDVQCLLKHVDYAAQVLSIYQALDIYRRDNPDQGKQNLRSAKLQEIYQQIELIQDKAKELHSRFTLFLDAQKIKLGALAAQEVYSCMSTLTYQYEYQQINEQEYLQSMNYLLAEDRPLSSMGPSSTYAFPFEYLDRIQENVKLLREHRGWKPFFVNFLASGVGCLVGKQRVSHISMFQKILTDSGSKLETLNNHIENTFPGY